MVSLFLFYSRHNNGAKADTVHFPRVVGKGDHAITGYSQPIDESIRIGTMKEGGCPKYSSLKGPSEWYSKGGREGYGKGKTQSPPRGTCSRP
jgi:hypothetical protein